LQMLSASGAMPISEPGQAPIFPSGAAAPHLPAKWPSFNPRIF